MNNAVFEKKHVLIVSDEPRALAELKMELMDCFDVTIAASSSAVISALEMYNVALVIIHIGDNRDAAFSVFDGIAEFVKNNSVPVMFLASKDNETDETNAFAVGAVDYTVNRRSTATALISRINHRIIASEAEKRISSGCGKELPTAAFPESDADGRTILVVDDMELNREIIAGMFEGMDGFILEFAEDGEDAVAKFAQSPTKFSLVLMDIQMPVMDGIDATKAIRKLDCENARTIPIVALSAADEEEETVEYLNAGMNGFLKKPMSYDQLVNTVSKHCI